MAELGVSASVRLASSIFRVTYAALDHPVAVTVLGRVIGWYTPVPRPGQEQAVVADPAVVPGRPEAPDALGSPPGAARGSVPQTSPSGAVDALKPTTGMSQREKDRVLGRVAKGRTG